MGFQSEKEETISSKVEDMVKNEVKRTFNPEFLNRLDEIILFNALTEEDLIQIVELMIPQLNTEPGAALDHRHGDRGGEQVDPGQDADRPQATARVRCGAPCRSTSRTR